MANDEQAEATEQVETFTERDVLLTLAVRAIDCPEGFDAASFQEELTLLGYANLLEEAQEMLLVVRLEQVVVTRLIGKHDIVIAERTGAKRVDAWQLE